jgi:cell division protein FtsB
MDRHKELDDLAQVDRLIQDADRRIRALERTMREAVADWHDVTKAEDLLAQLRLALVKYKARRAAIAQFIDDMESGRL